MKITIEGTPEEIAELVFILVGLVDANAPDEEETAADEDAHEEKSDGDRVDLMIRKVPCKYAAKLMEIIEQVKNAR